MELTDYIISIRNRKITIPIYLIISFLTVFAIGPQYFLNLSFILNQTIIQNGFAVGSYDILLPSVISNLAFAFCVPLGPIISKKYGLRRSYLTLILLFLLGSIINTLSAQFSFLIMGRLIQGVSAGGLFLIILPVSLIKFPNAIRNRFLLLAIGGLFGSSAVGAFFGSLSLSSDSWRWLFGLSCVVSVGCFVTGYRILPKNQPAQQMAQSVDKRGIFLHCLIVLSLILPLANIQKLGINSNYVWPFLVIASVLFIIFVSHEWRIDNPMIPFRSLLSPKPICGSIMAFSSHVALICCIIGINGVLRNVEDVSFISLSYFYFWFIAGIIACAFFSSLLYDKLGAGGLGIIGSVVVALVSFRWGLLTDHTALSSLYLQIACLGGAIGMVLVSGALGTALAGDIHKASMRSLTLHYLRNMIGGVTAPMLGWFISRQYTVQYENLRNQIGTSNPEVAIQMDTLTHQMIESGVSAVNAQSYGMYSMLADANKSSLLGAYHHLFGLLLLLSVIMIISSVGMSITGKGRSLVQK